MISLSKITNHRIFRKQTVGEAAILITLVVFLAKIVGYFRDVLIAKYFGASGQTDAFLIALLIPSIVMGIISCGLSTLIIPVYLEKKAKNEQQAKIFVNQIFLLCLGGVTILSIIIYFFAPFFVKLFAYGFAGTQFNLAVQLTRYLIPWGIINVLIGLFVGLYQAHKQFLYPVIVSLFANALIVISLLLFTSRYGINAWTIGQLLFALVSFVALIMILWKKYAFFQNFSLNNIYWQKIGNFFYLLLPLLLIHGINSINQLVDKTIASSLSTGSISVLNFAQKIYLIPLSLLIIPLAIAVYPTFSNLALDKTKKNIYAQRIQQVLSISWYFIIPTIFILIILARPIVRFFFQRGAFDARATALTAQAMAVYSIGLIGYVANVFLAKVFFSFKNTKTPLIISAIAVGINIIGNLILSKLFGTAGIALATAIAISITCLFYLLALRKYFPEIHFRYLLFGAIKIVFISLPIIILAFLSLPYLTTAVTFTTLLIRFAIFGIVAVLLYALLSYLLNLDESKIMFNYLKARLSPKLNNE